MNPITTTTDASDPIFVATEVHARADVAFWAVYEELRAVGPEDSDHLPMQAALMTVLEAENALIDTAPSTQIGLRALEAHLREDRHRSARGVHSNDAHD